MATAVEAYKNDQTNNPSEQLPSSWDDIINDPKLGLNPDAIKDPWGGQYHLIVPSQHNNRLGFDVSCDCGGGEPVGNW